jgi:hypothetical protein
MSTLTGQSISGSYLSLIHLATNTQIANNTNTQLQDGAGNNIGVFVNTNGTLTATNFSGSLTGTASNATFALTARSSSYAQQATSASSANYASIAGFVVSASYAISASNLTGTASFANNATSASYANNAGNAATAISASFATTASFARNAGVFPFIGDALITGSLGVKGSVTISGSFAINNIPVGAGGWRSLSSSYSAVSQSSNIAIGTSSLNGNVAGARMVGIGYEALYSAGIFTGSAGDGNDGTFDTTAIGYKAGYSIDRFGKSTYVGAYAGFGDFGDQNTAIGWNAIGGVAVVFNRKNAGGFYNTAVGASALFALSGSISFAGGFATPLSGLRNVAIGTDAGGGIVTGNDNIAVGYRTVYGLDSGLKNQNIAVGTRALQSLQSGSQNTFIGYYVESDINTPNLESGSRNIIIGSDHADMFKFGSGNTIIGNAIDFTPFTTSGNTTLNNTIIIASGNGSVKAVHSGSAWLLNSVSGSFTGSLSSTTLTSTSTSVIVPQVSSSLNFANDTAAAAGGVPLGGLYRNGNAIQVRIS